MSTHAPTSSLRAFTLLEMMIATMMVAMLAMTCHRFLATNLDAMRMSSEVEDERAAMQSVIRLVQMQLNDLPLRESGVLAGQPFKFQNLSNDEITWRCGAGPGLLTTAAEGEFRVTLTVQPVSKRSNETELGLRRQIREPNPSTNSKVFAQGGGDRKYNWLRLIRPMAALEIRYFDSLANVWTDRWVDPVRRPNLVRVRLWKRAGDDPVEAVLPVPSAQIQS